MSPTLANTTNRRTAKTVVIEHATRMLSIKAIEFLPDMFQSRASLDPTWQSQYAADMKKGDGFPAITVYELSDGRLVCVDGFHRAGAAQMIGLLEIRAQIIQGTMQDAILKAIEANQAPFHRGRPFTQEDRRHAVKLMIRNETTRDWSDTEIARRTGVNTGIVRYLRAELAEAESIPFPLKSLIFKDGVFSGTKRAYRSSIKSTYAHIDDTSSEARDNANGMIRNHSTFTSWLVTRGITGTRRHEAGSLSGSYIRDSLFYLVPDANLTSIVYAIGKITLVRVYSPEISRAILVGYFGSILGSPSPVKLARQLPNPIEFMTPEEFVAEFGPKDGEPESSGPNPA